MRAISFLSSSFVALISLFKFVFRRLEFAFEIVFRRHFLQVQRKRLCQNRDLRVGCFSGTPASRSAFENFSVSKVATDIIPPKTFYHGNRHERVTVADVTRSLLARG
jgi:hypothetical protein